MAVTDSTHHATENLVLPTDRKYYRCNIDTSHWQLRSLISAPMQDIVYYPKKGDIIALNTKTRERTTIATVSFLPRCLTASKNWLCCGSESGELAIIDLRTTRMDLYRTNQAAEADERLILDFNRDRTYGRQDGSLPNFRAPDRPLIPKVLSISKEIVNCLTIWDPDESSDGAPAAYKFPVLVASTNDCKVSILALASADVLTELKLPDLTNRAILSPDGTLLATIGDDPFLYVHERRLKSGQSATPRLKSYEWVMAGKVQLQGQRSSDTSSMRGSFASCFSRSGKYLAVATQYGVIHVFDVQCLVEPDSLVATFDTSRAGRDCDAVRAMEFCPGPFDLLAWTESKGRVGVADMRTGFVSRQLITIDPRADGVDNIIITDREGEISIDPRLLQRDPASSTTPDYLGLGLERRHLRHLTREMLDRHQTPLTSEELEVLQAHQIARQQRDSANASAHEQLLRDSEPLLAWETRHTARDDAAPQRSQISPPADGGAEAAGSSSRATNSWEMFRPSPSSEERRISTAGLPAVLREFISPDRSGSSFRSFINERNAANERRANNADDPLDLEPPVSNVTSIADTLNLLELETNAIEASRYGTQRLYNQNPESSEPRAQAFDMAARQRARRDRSAERRAREEFQSTDYDGTYNNIQTRLERLIARDGPAAGIATFASPWTADDNDSTPSLYRPQELNSAGTEAARARLRLAAHMAAHEDRDDSERTRDFAHRLRRPWRFSDMPGSAAQNQDEPSLRRLGGRVGETMGLTWSEDGRVLYAATCEGLHEYRVNINGRKQFPSLVFR